MPLFEYRCKKCGHQFEVLVRGSESPECPSCHSRGLDKLMSVPAAHAGQSQLPLMSSCPPSNAPPCGPGCCRLPD